jgi:hypothetical protein
LNIPSSTVYYYKPGVKERQKEYRRRRRSGPFYLEFKKFLESYKIGEKANFNLPSNINPYILFLLFMKDYEEKYPYGMRYKCIISQLPNFSEKLIKQKELLEISKSEETWKRVIIRLRKMRLIIADKNISRKVRYRLSKEGRKLVDFINLSN